MRRSAAAAFALVLMVGACSSDGGGSGSANGTSGGSTVESRQQTPQERFGDALSARVGADGAVDLQLALDLYASAYGHADQLGATALPGDNTEGTLALNAVLAHWSELTAAQQAVVQADLAVAPARSEVIVAVAGAAGPARSPVLPRPVLDTDPTTVLVQRARDEISTYWGSPLPVPVRVDFMADDLPPTADGGMVLADARQVDADGGPVSDPTQYATCAVRVFPALGRQSEVDRLATLAHETFHCFQYVGRTYPTLAEFGQWVVEGQAQWVGATVAGGGPVATAWWRVWLLQAHPLWSRTYDAMGFYASLARRGDDVWGTFQRMLDGSPGFASTYATTVGSRGPGFMGDVAVDRSSLLLVGQPWLPAGPGAAAVDAGTAYPVGHSGRSDLSATVQPYDTTRFEYAAPDPVLAVSSDTAPWAVGSAGLAQVHRDADEAVLCLQTECRCPDGQLLAATALGDVHLVGVGVADTRTDPAVVNVSARGYSLEEACAHFPRLSTGPDACMIGHWRLAEQTPGAEFLPGLSALDLRGGVGGRTLVIRSDGSYTMTDDGSDPTRGHGTVSGTPVDLLVVLTGQVDGTVSVSTGHATFAATTVNLRLHVEETVSGVAPVVIDDDLTDSSMVGNGDAVVSCSGTTMTLVFENASFTYTFG